ncbi:carboxymuconolactone decarboxylase family protein [Paeniglutamicibacter sp. MACA_103]|uniref:carboxymuconolactone decarboxylase family protein n=1 Tax=Paeniglutamicibacter sp. MACA_103 TaxID=3377337 RepID=UPI0038934BF6
MSRIEFIQPETAEGTAATLLKQVQGAMGAVPNMAKAMANSPAALKGYLRLSAALAGGALDAVTRERLALTTAQANACDYCLSVHTYTGTHQAGLGKDEILDARRARAADPKTDAVLKFAAAILETRGAVTKEQFTAVRTAGATDEEIGEIVAAVALNTLTNFYNKAAAVDIDFPTVRAADLQGAMA